MINKMIISAIGIVAIIIIGYVVLADPDPTPIDPIVVDPDDPHQWDNVTIYQTIRCFGCLADSWQDLVFVHTNVCPEGWVSAVDFDEAGYDSNHANCDDINEMLGNEPAIPSKPAEIRVITDSDANPSMPYIYDASHGYLSEKQISQILKNKFNNWIDNPITSTHCCRHICMEVETYLEREYAVDVLWVLGSRYDSGGNQKWHVWLEILVDDGCFHSFDPTTMEWTLNSKYDVSNVFHGNFLYGEFRVEYHDFFTDYGTIIPEVIDYHNYRNIPSFESNYKDFELWEYPEPNRDVVLPASILQMITGQFMVGD